MQGPAEGGCTVDWMRGSRGPHTISLRRDHPLTTVPLLSDCASSRLAMEKSWNDGMTRQVLHRDINDFETKSSVVKHGDVAPSSISRRDTICTSTGKLDLFGSFSYHLGFFHIVASESGAVMLTAPLTKLGVSQRTLRYCILTMTLLSDTAISVAVPAPMLLTLNTLSVVLSAHLSGG